MQGLVTPTGLSLNPGSGLLESLKLEGFGKVGKRQDEKRQAKVGCCHFCQISVEDQHRGAQNQRRW